MFQIILISVVSIVLLLYYWSTSTFDYWKKRNVPFVKPIPYFGNLLPYVRKQENYKDSVIRIYKSLNGEPFGGFFEMRTPVLCVRDPKLIHAITVTDFDHFVDRAFNFVYNPCNKKLNPLSRNVTLLRGDKWRMVRSSLSPGFTSKKLNEMLPQAENCIANINKLLSQKSREGSVDIFKIMLGFSVNLIGSCCFGLDCSAQNENSEFTRIVSKTLSGSDNWYSLRCFLMSVNFRFLDLLKIPDLPKDVTSFFQNMISDAVKYRETTGDVRKDLLQMMMDMRHKRKNEEPDQLESSNSDQIDDDDIAAYAFGIFAATFETMSITMSQILYQLALNPDVQDKVRQEIQEMKTDDSEYLTNLKYLDMIISETLRIMPSSGFDRVCTKDYVIPGTNITLEKGTKVLIPTSALQNDPEHYENPEKFDPERFSEENKVNITRGSYIPYGEGQRSCLGIQFAQRMLNLSLRKIIEKYEFSPCEKTSVPLQYKHGEPKRIPSNGVWLNVKEITNVQPAYTFN